MLDKYIAFTFRELDTYLDKKTQISLFSQYLKKQEEHIMQANIFCEENNITAIDVITKEIIKTKDKLTARLAVLRKKGEII